MVSFCSRCVSTEEIGTFGTSVKQNNMGGSGIIITGCACGVLEVTCSKGKVCMLIKIQPDTTVCRYLFT